MARLALDGRSFGTPGQALRTALAVSAATGQGFEISGFRIGRTRSGLQPHHLATIRAAALVCDAKVGSAFEGSLELRFEPGPVQPGSYDFEIERAGAATLVLQTVLPALARASAPSRVEVLGGTHVPGSPSADYLFRHWSAAVAETGLGVEGELRCAGFYPRGGGELCARVQPWRASASPAWVVRGELLRICGVSGAAKLRGDVAARQAESMRARIWERSRFEAAIEIVTPPAAGPGSYLLLQAVFANGRAAFAAIGEKGVRPEVMGDRVARRLLKFIDGESALDPQLADQLAVPLALAGGGSLTTSEVTRRLQAVADVLNAFGVPARTWGRLGGPGGLEVDHV